MNCQDVALILDDRDAGALGAAERREMDAHLAICPDCTRDWQVHTRLAAALVPAVPVELRGRIRAKIAAHSVRNGGWRAPRRPVLLALFATCAAAAMLIHQLAPTADPAKVPVPVVLPAPATVAVPVTVAAEETRLPPAFIPAAPDVAANRSGFRSAPAAPRQIRLQVMPLLNQATGEAIAAVDAAYAAFLDGLRKVPGVTLIAGDASAAEHAEFRLKLRGIGPLPGDQFRVYLSTEGMEADGSWRAMVSTMQSSDIVPACGNTGVQSYLYGPCSGAAMVAAQQVQFVRSSLISPSPQPRDPASVGLSVLSSSTSPNAVARASAWRTARGLRLPELMQPLITALQQEPDGNARAHAAATLAADFGDDPVARAALETAAKSNSNPLVRAFVEQTLRGNQAWNDYLIDSMMDANRPAMERLEALCFAMEERPVGTTRFDLEGLLRSHDAIESLAGLLSRTSPWPKSNGMVMLVGGLASIEHPAAVGLLVDHLDRFRELMTGGSLVYQLSRHGSDPRARAALEKISSSDPDPSLRENAADALKKIAAGPAGAAQSPTR